MDEFLTDEQQAENAKRWIRSNGGFIVAGIVLGVGILVGMQQWRDYKLEVAGEASIVWEQLRGAIEGDRRNEIDESLDLLESEYASTPYLDQARLALARMHMESNDSDAAIEQLQALAKSANDPHMRRIGQLRLAQALIYTEQYDAALEAMGTSDNTALASQFHELRGDVYFAQGDLEAAREAYELALESDVGGVLDRSFVQIKLDDVAGSIVANADAADDGEALSDAAAAEEPAS